MAIVAYLLGAGASANCIPVVNGMAEDMDELVKQLDGYYPAGMNSSNNEFTERENFTKIFQILKNLNSICLSHFSIDTYAKKLYLTSNSQFERLKLDLSLYFTLKQIVTLPDKRYDNFFSSVLATKRKLPSNIKIISWNYDFQVEKSFFEFNNNLDLDSCQLVLGVNCPKNHRDYDDFKGKFNVLKLNGSAKIKTTSHDGFLVSMIDRTVKRQVHDVVNKYLGILEKGVEYKCELKFAWENENYESLFKKAEQDLSSIEVLVIIGYSFPFFNREVDKELFAKMSRLKKIYIQDMNPENIKETMDEFVKFNIQSFNTIEVVYKRNLAQFVFPKELV